MQIVLALDKNELYRYAASISLILERGWAGVLCSSPKFP
jgi:hypothetical protein